VKVGWEVIAWTGEPRPCNVPACGRRVRSGHVRVDNIDHKEPGFVVVCADCWFKIMLGIDPDPDAKVPAWEEERRAKASPDS
jgi:hypothetical protein